jgi:hypothetical protein
LADLGYEKAAAQSCDGGGGWERAGVGKVEGSWGVDTLHGEACDAVQYTDLARSYLRLMSWPGIAHFSSTLTRGKWQRTRLLSSAIG